MTPTPTLTPDEGRLLAALREAPHDLDRAAARIGVSRRYAVILQQRLADKLKCAPWNVGSVRL